MVCVCDMYVCMCELVHIYVQIHIHVCACGDLNLWSNNFFLFSILFMGKSLSLSKMIINEQQM